MLFYLKWLCCILYSLGFSFFKAPFEAWGQHHTCEYSALLLLIILGDYFLGLRLQCQCELKCLAGDLRIATGFSSSVPCSSLISSYPVVPQWTPHPQSLEFIKTVRQPLPLPALCSGLLLYIHLAGTMLRLHLFLFFFELLIPVS